MRTRFGRYAAAPKSVDYKSLTDQEVVARAREGREAAFRELIGRYERPVFSLIYRLLRDRERSEDLTQDTFIKVLNHIDKYRPEFKLSSWLFKIANNVAIDHLRRAIGVSEKFRANAREDSDFDSIRDEASFKALID